jgi:hypothetical protein
MRSFLRYLLLFFIIVAVTWVRIPQAYDLEFPKNPGPAFDNQVRDLYINKLEREKPELVLLGDSTLMEGVDPGQLSRLTELKVSSFDDPGSASAYWYVVLKNNIAQSENKPKYLVILFRDSILTAPGYRVHGSYFIQLDEFARRREPILLERAYLNLMNPLEKAADSYFPLYGARVQIRQQIDTVIRYSIPRWLGCDVECTDASMYNVFEGSNLQPGQLQNAVASAERYLYTGHRLDFKRQINDSFLPEMIHLAKDNNIRLILVRLKSQTQGEYETPAVRRYISALSRYLSAEDVLFLDYGRDPRLIDEYYADTLHLSREGEAVFTEMLAERLNNALK